MNVRSAHIDYQKLNRIFEHSDILFRFQRLLSIQGKACKDLSTVLKRKPYHHNHVLNMRLQSKCHRKLRESKNTIGLDSTLYFFIPKPKGIDAN